MLDEVHLLADCALTDDVVVGLEDLELQLAQHPRHKVRVSVGKQRHGGHQLAAVEVDNFLLGWKEKKKRKFKKFSWTLALMLGGRRLINCSSTTASTKTLQICRLRCFYPRKWTNWMHMAALSLILVKHFPLLRRGNFLAEETDPDEFALRCRLQAISALSSCPLRPSRRLGACCLFTHTSLLLCRWSADPPSSDNGTSAEW